MILLLLLACAGPEECEIPADGLGALTAWEESFLQSGDRPDAPPVAFLDAEDGLPLAYREWVPADWEGTGAAVVFVPGSSAHSGLYTVIGAGLADRGVLVRIIDVRGHGLSVCAADGCGDPATVDRSPADDGATWVGRVGDSADADQLVRDLDLHLAAVAAAWPDASLHLAGHSSGAGVVSRSVERGASAWIDSAAVVAPFHHAEQPQIRDEVLLDCLDLAGTAYARLDLGALGDALRGNVHRYVLTLHKEDTYADPLDTLAYSWTTTQGMATTHPTAFWDAYTVPVLLVAGQADALLDPDRSAEQVERARDGAFWLVPDTSHVGLIWSDDVAEGLATWFTTGEAP